MNIILDLIGHSSSHRFFTQIERGP